MKLFFKKKVEFFFTERGIDDFVSVEWHWMEARANCLIYSNPFSLPRDL